MPIVVRIRKGETLERALRRFKRKIDREDIIPAVRSKLHYVKPSVIRRKKKEAAIFMNKVRQRYENM